MGALRAQIGWLVRGRATTAGTLEALSGDRPDGDGVEMLNRFIDQVSDAALSALSRNSDANPIVVSEADLE